MATSPLSLSESTPSRSSLQFSRLSVSISSSPVTSIRRPSLSGRSPFRVVSLAAHRPSSRKLAEVSQDFAGIVDFTISSLSLSITPQFLRISFFRTYPYQICCCSSIETTLFTFFLTSEESSTPIPSTSSSDPYICYQTFLVLCCPFCTVLTIQHLI